MLTSTVLYPLQFINLCACIIKLISLELVYCLEFIVAVSSQRMPWLTGQADSTQVIRHSSNRQ